MVKSYLREPAVKTLSSDDAWFLRRKDQVQQDGLDTFCRVNGDVTI